MNIQYFICYCNSIVLGIVLLLTRASVSAWLTPLPWMILHLLQVTVPVRGPLLRVGWYMVPCLCIRTCSSPLGTLCCEPGITERVEFDGFFFIFLFFWPRLGLYLLLIPLHRLSQTVGLTLGSYPQPLWYFPGVFLPSYFGNTEDWTFVIGFN